jgi:alanine-glyoxylate transaminase/serine-glyoxylate transaminase/serine-pyruvate transaminase
MGLGLLADPEFRLNPLTTVLVPEGVDDAAVRRRLIDDHNIEVGGGLGDIQGRVWRIGLMGEGAREANVFTVLSALEQVLSRMDYEVAIGAGLAAAQGALLEFEARELKAT